MKFLWILFTLLAGIPCINSSAGDRDSEFQNCIAQDNCYKCQDLNIWLILTAWSCLDNCKYSCMKSISSSRLKQGLPLLQYYGKWPFIRILGIQEPASVLFSLGNMYAHFKGYLRLLKFRESTQRNIYLNFARISMVLWIASTIFHTRDFPITEKADYFMAILGLEYSFYIATIKAWKLSFGSLKLLKRFLQVYFIWHVSYLSFRTFDYSYNMIAGITLGILTNLQWILWYLRIGRRTRYGIKQLAFTILISLAMSLEIFDFSPIFGLVDAHSLWHLSTIPLVYLHYSFLSDDLTKPF